MVKTGMIRFRKRDHKFASSLIASINAHSFRSKSTGIHESDELKKKVRLRLKQIRCLLPNGRLELLSIIAGNSIPCFCFAPMHWK